ncbi:MAG: hypothetical protein WA700_01745 [Acidobacteriaceae bacterium]
MALVVLAGIVCVLWFSLVSCNRDTGTKPMTILYDQWWSSDFAAQGAEMHCPAQAPKVCEDDARGDEADFLGRFSAAFESDPACAGLKLIVFGDPDMSSKATKQALSKIADKDRWFLMVDFKPEIERQAWRINLYPELSHQASGENDARTMAHSVCSIVKTTGGSVVN